MISQVVGQGAESPDIILIGDYPTEEELSNKKAFVGSTDSLFSSLFRGAGYPLTKTYRTQFCKEAAGSDLQTRIRKGKVKFDTLKLAESAYFDENCKLILEEVNDLKPKVIIAAGDAPLWYLARELKIRKFRGSIIPCAFDKIPYVAILPPRYIYSDIKFKVVTQLDVLKGVNLLRNGWIPFEQKYRIWTAFNNDALIEYLKRTRGCEYYVVDIETIYNFITCIGFCASGSNEAVCVPLFDPRVSHKETVLLYRTIDSFLRNPSIKKVGQNFNYDWTVLEKRGFTVNGFMGDSMLLSHCIYPDFPKGLDFLTSVHTDIPYYKDEGKEAFKVHSTQAKSLDKLYAYNAKDCLANQLIYEDQKVEAEELGVKEFYEKIEFPLIFLYHDIEKNGILVDESQLMFLVMKYEILLESYEKRTKEICGESINFGSSQQIAKLVYDFLGCEPRYNKSIDEETGRTKKTLATDEETLEEIALLYTPSEVVKSILYNIIAIRKLQKICQWLQTPIHPDGRMRTSAKLTGTKSGRTSFSKTIDYTLLYDKKGKIKKIGMGNSFQTIPKHGDTLQDGTTIGDDLRTIFVPRRGHVFMEGDKSQAEARVVSVLSDDIDFIYNFDNPPGVHKITAGWIFQCPPEEIQKDTEEYQLGKRGRHMANYDGTAHRLATMAHLSLKKASYVLDQIHANAPKIRGVFHETIRSLLQKHATFETPQGRRRQNFKRVDKDTEKEFFSYIPQATVSDDLKLGMMRMWETQNKDPWFYFLNEAHDSALAETAIENKDRYVDLFNKEMQQPIDFRRGSFYRDYQLTIPVELASSDTNWADMQRIK